MSNVRLKLKPCSRCGKDPKTAILRKALEQLPYWMKFCQSCRNKLAAAKRHKRLQSLGSRILNRRLSKNLSWRF